LATGLNDPKYLNVFNKKLTKMRSKVCTLEGKYLVTQFEFGGSFGMNLLRGCHELKVIINLEFLVIFGMSLEGVCQ
jgi:hypothetical protein